MSLPLFLVDELPAGESFTLAGAEGRHAADAMRMRTGEELLLGDGVGGVVRAVVRTAGRGALDLSIVERRYERRPARRLVAVQGIAKGERSELAVQAMTEVGVDEVVPWSASRSVAVWRGERGDKARERWRSTAREAAKQARRAWVPEIGPARTTAEVAGLDGTVLVLHEEAAVPLSTVDIGGGGDVAVVIGPEGGIAPEELSAFVSAGAVAVRLGASVLRTSTAGPVALAILAVRLGRW